MLFCRFNHIRYLLKRTEYNHAGSILFPFGRLFFQKAAAKGEILRNIESKIRIECRFSCLVTFTIFVVPVNIPVRTAGIKISADVVGNIGNYKLCFRNAVAFEVLKIIME